MEVVNGEREATGFCGGGALASRGAVGAVVAARGAVGALAARCPVVSRGVGVGAPPVTTGSSAGGAG